MQGRVLFLYVSIFSTFSVLLSECLLIFDDDQQGIDYETRDGTVVLNSLEANAPSVTVDLTPGALICLSLCNGRKLSTNSFGGLRLLLDVRLPPFLPPSSCSSSPHEPLLYLLFPALSFAILFSHSRPRLLCRRSRRSPSSLFFSHLPLFLSPPHLISSLRPLSIFLRLLIFCSSSFS